MILRTNSAYGLKKILTLDIFNLFYTHGLCYVDAKSNLTNDGAEAANAGGRGRRWRRRHRQWNGTFHSTLMSRFISSRHEKTGAADYRGSAIMLRRAALLFSLFSLLLLTLARALLSSFSEQWTHYGMRRRKWHRRSRLAWPGAGGIRTQVTQSGK